MSTNKLQELTASMEKLRTEMKEQAKSAFLTVFQEMFEQHPKLEGVRWTQSTPYFNDGDPCVFGVNEPRISMSYFRELSEEQAEEFCDNYGDCYEPGDPVFLEHWDMDRSMNTVEPADAVWDAIKVVFQSGEELFLYAFGDHSQITVMRSGEVTIDSYDHD